MSFFWGFICGTVVTFLLQFFLCCATSIELGEYRKNEFDEHAEGLDDGNEHKS